MKRSMWTCPKCGRIFNREGQQHSCKKVPLESHFTGKQRAKELYDAVADRIGKEIGPVKTISLPCCVHLFGTYDFVALLPKKDKLEIRFALDRELKDSRIYTTVPLSKSSYKNCLYVWSKDEIDDELIEWLKESYNLKKM